VRRADAAADDGTVYFGTALYAGKVAFRRPAIVNWRTQAEDVDLVVPTVLRLGCVCRASGLVLPG
jgi:hypothetical protein